MQSAKILFVILFTQSLFCFSQTKRIEPKKGLVLFLPSAFELMSDDNMAQKYPSYKKPIAVYESKDGKAEIGINAAVNTWRNNNLLILKDMYKSTISSIFTQVEYIQDGNIVEVNQRKFIYFEFISTVVDDKRIDNIPVYTKKYNYLAYTLYENKILIFNFNSTLGSKTEWMPIAADIMKSIKISTKLKIDEYEPFQTEGPQPKAISGRKDMQMEALKKIQIKKKN